MRRLEPVRGYSLIELLVAAAVLLIVGAVVVSVFLTVFKGVAVLTVRSAVTSGLRNAVEQFGRDAAQAQEAPASCSASYTASATQLILMGPPGTSRYVVYRPRPASGACTAASPCVLERLTLNSACDLFVTQTRVIANNVISLAFTRRDLDATPATIERVDIWLGIRARVQQQQLQGKILTTFKLRN